MKILLKLEEVAMFGASIWLFSTLGFAWWWYPVLLFVPDLSMAGYLGGTRAGALVYNFFHHKALGIITFSLGLLLAFPWLQLAGVILFGHASLDRALGFGLKFPDSFQHTHLEDLVKR